MKTNLQQRPDISAMCGPTVTVTTGSDGIAVEVGREFGRTALTPEEWGALAAKRGDKPYVLVDTEPGRPAYVSPPRTYADAQAEFDRDVASGSRHRNYRPDSGRRLMVMTQADYLARRDGGEQW